MSAKVMNTERLLRKLAALPEAAKADIRPALEKSAAEIVALAKSLVPTDSGALRDSIGWTWGSAPEGSRVLGTVAAGDLTITLFAGSSDAYHARWIEFGTVKMNRQPYFFPAYRALRKRSLRRIKAAGRKAAKRVAAG